MEKNPRGCCDECWKSKFALNPRNEKKRIESGCGLSCECHLRKEHLLKKSVKPTQPSQHIEKNCCCEQCHIDFQEKDKYDCSDSSCPCHSSIEKNWEADFDSQFDYLNARHTMDQWDEYKDFIRREKQLSYEEGQRAANSGRTQYLNGFQAGKDAACDYLERKAQLVGTGYILFLTTDHIEAARSEEGKTLTN